MKTKLNYLVLAYLVPGIIMLNSCKKEPDPIHIPTVATSSVSDITPLSALVRGTITGDGGAEVTACGFCWSTSQNPTINDSKTFAGKSPGDFVSRITGLMPKTIYYVRSYATNIVGTAYGNEISFSSLDLTSSEDVINSFIVSVSSTSAVVTGNVFAGRDGYNLTGSGVCWNTTGNPTTADSKTMNVIYSGIFTSNLTGLTEGTTYFARVYAVFANGNIIYGNELIIKTLGVSPIIFNNNLTYGSVSDIDGNDYKTIQIGSQEWMAENLKTTKYNDGISIPNITNIYEWSSLTSGAYCWYNNTAAAFKATYGALYNWFAANTTKLCPENWHVPSDTEWAVLITYLGGESIAGEKLMETGTTHWLSPDPNATNITGFTGLPGGFRYTDDGFGNADYPFDALGYYGFWWSASEYGNADAGFFNISSWDPGYPAATYVSTIIKNGGMSVRCVKD